MWDSKSSLAQSRNIKSQLSYTFLHTIVLLDKEDHLKSALTDIRPIAIAVDASASNFEKYGGGIYYNNKCKSGLNDLTHAMLLVDYGTENGNDFWLVKNSWSINWGLDGYIKMARNKQNNCGIATEACYPLLEWQ